MRITPTFALVVVALPALCLTSHPLPGGPPAAPPPRMIDARYAPYSSDPKHSWNQLHQALFVRALPAGGRVVHTTDPLLYRGGTYLLVDEPHERALRLLDRFNAQPDEPAIGEPLKRLYFQRDLWAAFDYAAWYPDDWVFKSKHEPAAIALRNRLAKAIGKLAHNAEELSVLPDNYALAVKSKDFAAGYDPKHPERPFLPPDLFDPAGTWVRFHEVDWHPMTERHFEAVGGRAAHVVFLRLPGGRAETESYLNGLRPTGPTFEERFSLKQFPDGTMTAMVRRALTVDRGAKVRATPITELVQIRVYRQVPKNPEARIAGSPVEQDVYEFILNRDRLFAGEHGLRAVGPHEPAEPFFERSGDRDPFERGRNPIAPRMTQLRTCIECHNAPGVYSMLSMNRGLHGNSRARGEVFRTYDWDVEMDYTIRAKSEQFSWGLLKGKLEAK
jgi:hypothetical protein